MLATPYCSPDYDEIVRLIGGSGTGPPSKSPFGGKVTCHYCDTVLSSPCSWRVHMREMHMFSSATVKAMNPNERDPFERRFHCPTCGDSLFFEAPFRSHTCRPVHIARAKLLGRFDLVTTTKGKGLSPRPGTSSQSRLLAEVVSDSIPIVAGDVGPLPSSPQHKCTKCGLAFTFPISLAAHTCEGAHLSKSKRPSPGRKCPHCSFIARNSGGLQYHQHLKHRNTNTGPALVDKRKASPSSVPADSIHTNQSATNGSKSSVTSHSIPPSISSDTNGSASYKISCPAPPSIPSASTSPRNTLFTRCPENIPEYTCRRGNSLNILFPIRGKLACVENGCSRKFSGETIAKSPAGHGCLMDISPILPPATPFPLAFECCSASFPTEKGLQNHAASHKKEEILSSGAKKLIAVPKRRRRKGRIHGPTPPESEDEAIQVP
ncbi:hypothetical protein HNY73_007421 [Argiope bruennichi]|uniref:C2H2-type domain-containing protein n=1 Tax=Argiope bruennichi TaxID=94029 RepID=A0A8T0FGY2_ARGBR|nr:hypothetical protein HNY73_007421 [Argiope bruennichi]